MPTPRSFISSSFRHGHGFFVDLFASRTKAFARHIERGYATGTDEPLRALYEGYHPPWAKGRCAKFAGSGTALRAMFATPATPPAHIEPLGCVAPQALLEHGNSRPLAATAP